MWPLWTTWYNLQPGCPLYHTQTHVYKHTHSVSTVSSWISQLHPWFSFCIYSGSRQNSFFHVPVLQYSGMSYLDISAYLPPSLCGIWLSHCCLYILCILTILVYLFIKQLISSNPDNSLSSAVFFLPLKENPHICLIVLSFQFYNYNIIQEAAPNTAVKHCQFIYCIL